MKELSDMMKFVFMFAILLLGARARAMTPLCEAASRINLPAIKKAISSGESVNSICVGSFGMVEGRPIQFSPLTLVLRFGQSLNLTKSEREVVALYLIDQGADPLFLNTDKRKLPGKYQYVLDEKTNLDYLVSFDSPPAIVRIFSLNPKLASSSEARAARDRAIDQEKLDVAEALIMAGTNPYLSSSTRDNFLAKVLEVGTETQINRTLQWWDFRIDNHNLSAYLKNIITSHNNGSVELLKYFIRLGANPNEIPSGNGFSINAWNLALTQTVLGRESLIDYILSLGVDPLDGGRVNPYSILENYTYYEGSWLKALISNFIAKGYQADTYNPLFVLSNADRDLDQLIPGMVKSAGAKLNQEMGSDHLIPLSYGIYMGGVSGVLKLIELGADVNLPDFSGNTPLCYALHSVFPTDQTVLNALKAHGAVIGTCHRTGNERG